MNKRFSIIVRELGSDREVVLAECDSNPEAIAEGLRHKKAGTGKKGGKLSRYDWIRVVSNDVA